MTAASITGGGHMHCYICTGGGHMLYRWSHVVQEVVTCCTRGDQ